MKISSAIKFTGNIPNDIISHDIVKQMVGEGIQEATNWQSSGFYNEIILPLKNQVNDYVIEFNNAVEDYMIANSVLRKMKNSLNPTNINKGNKTIISKDKLNNNKQATNHLKAIMFKGHTLLLNIRQRLTGQDISTKFIVQVKGRTYQISEKQIDPNLIFSTFGGGTVSNPFSLAYQIDIDMLQAQNLLIEENEITKTDIWQTIWSLKPKYLEEKRKKWASQGIKREYPNIFFDSKDAEIYELYQQQTNLPSLENNVAEYARLRASMGGGGGYASAFYKMGDVGSTQVKFFNLKEGVKSTTVNFARFSLIRDRLRQLNEILSMTNPVELKNKLIQFFTEDEMRVEAEVSKEFNKVAKETIESLFVGFS